MGSLRSAVIAFASVLNVIISVAGYAISLGYGAIMFLEVAHAPGLASSRPMLLAARWLSPSIHTVSSWFGWYWPRGAHLNFAPLILAVAALIATNVITGIISNAISSIGVRRLLFGAIPTGTPAASPQPEIRRAETEKERTALLKRYRELEDALKSSASKSCTFLSIDVVDSTQMKVGENPTAIAATFQAYEEMVKQTFESHEVWKSTWTPDGVMCCFLDHQLALRAAQQILVALPAFNAGQNRLKTPFKIRCGINKGDVTIFEDSQLEKVSDHAIDIAGHMQKYAGDNALQLSVAFYDELEDKSGFSETGREVDGMPTCEWRCKQDTLIERVAQIVGGRRSQQ
jgi:class 3 adenylate cyclase